MNDKKLIENLDSIKKKSDALKLEISSLPSSMTKTNVISKWNTLETDIVSVDGLVRKLPGKIFVVNRLWVFLLTLFVGALIGSAVIAIFYGFPALITYDEPTAEINPYPDRPIVGSTGVTNQRYVELFNKSFIGYVTDVNMTNRSDSALVTLENGDDEITLNEYWITWANEQWFEDVYGVSFDRIPAHFANYSGTYQFLDDWFEPAFDDFLIIHTEDGMIRLEYSPSSGQNTPYYYNNTYPGGAEVRYEDKKFIIICSQEEIEYEKIL